MTSIRCVFSSFKSTRLHGSQAGGMHPTGMHSCSVNAVILRVSSSEWITLIDFGFSSFKFHTAGAIFRLLILHLQLPRIPLGYHLHGDVT